MYSAAGSDIGRLGSVSVSAQVNSQDIMEAKVPEENIQIFPHDVIIGAKGRNGLRYRGREEVRWIYTSARSRTCRSYRQFPWRKASVRA